MRELLTPEHRMIATQLREEARCWPFRRQIIEHRLRVLTNEQGDVEKVIWGVIYNFNDHQRSEINVAVRRLRDALTKADAALGNDELGNAEAACEQSEYALNDLRALGANLGIIHEREETS
jgi:hypothetical protein